jgi:hypothetical protein
MSIASATQGTIASDLTYMQFVLLGKQGGEGTGKVFLKWSNFFMINGKHKYTDSRNLTSLKQNKH